MNYVKDFLTKLLSVMWKDVKDEDGDEYEHYKEMAAADKLRYEKEIETYVPSDDEEPEKRKRRRQRRTKMISKR